MNGIRDDWKTRCGALLVDEEKGSVSLDARQPRSMDDNSKAPFSPAQKKAIIESSQAKL